MPRSALAQNYTLNEETILDDFGDINNWEIVGNHGTIEANTEQYRTGAQSMKMTAISPGGPAYGEGLIAVRRNYTPAVNLNADARPFRLWMYIHSGLNTVKDYTLTFHSQINVDYFEISITASLVNEGWNNIALAKSGFDIVGSPSWDSIVRIDIAFNSIDGERACVSLDSFSQSLEQIPKCLISFDDGWQSAYDEAYVYMKSKGLRCTMYIIPSLVGQADYVDTDDLDAMYADGFAIANHTYSHPGGPTLYLRNLSRAQIDEEIGLAIDWFNSHGFTRAAHHLAYPGGQYNDDVLASMAAWGMKTGRSCLNMYNPVPVGNIYLLHSNDLTSDMSLAAAKRMIDAAIRDNLTIIFHGHKLAETADTGSWAIADFQALIDYIVARRISCVTIDEWYEGLTNPRYRSLPPARIPRQ